MQIRSQNKQIKQTVNNQYDETLRKSMSDLYEVYRTDFNVETKAECELLATRILDILAVLAKLNNKGIIDDDLLEFVEFDLEIAKGIMKWYDKEGLGKKYSPSSSAKIWSNLTIYFNWEKNTVHPHQQKFGLILLSISRNIKSKYVRMLHYQIAYEIIMI